MKSYRCIHMLLGLASLAWATVTSLANVAYASCLAVFRFLKEFPSFCAKDGHGLGKQPGFSDVRVYKGLLPAKMYGLTMRQRKSPMVRDSWRMCPSI